MQIASSSSEIEIAGPAESAGAGRASGSELLALKGSITLLELRFFVALLIGEGGVRFRVDLGSKATIEKRKA